MKKIHTIYNSGEKITTPVNTQIKETPKDTFEKQTDTKFLNKIQLKTTTSKACEFLNLNAIALYISLIASPSTSILVSSANNILKKLNMKADKMTTKPVNKISEAKERDEIPEVFKWNIDDIYKNIDEWETDFRKCDEMLPKIDEFKGMLGESSQKLLDCVETVEKLRLISEKLYFYAHLRLDEDQRKTQWQAYKSRSLSMDTKINSALSFIEPEILEIPPEKIELFLKENKKLMVYKFYIEGIQRLKPHTLSKNEEELISATGDIRSEITNSYAMITGADMQFPKAKDETGKEVTITEGVYSKALESPSREIRKTFFETYLGNYNHYLNTIASILNAKLKSDFFIAKAKKYKTSLEYSLNQDNIPVSVYENLIKTVNENIGTLHRYYSMRKKLSGLTDYSVFDNSYNLLDVPEKDIPYNKAVDEITEALKPMGSEYTELIKKAVKERWIDVFENKGKRTGAYSSSCYDVPHPYILMNYQNNLSSKRTLAHELGHNEHTCKTFESQPYVYSNYSIFTAEVASTFNEQLLFDYLIKNTEDKKGKLYLILTQLKEMTGTLFTQTMFAEFEKDAHERIESGDSLTKDDVNKLYLDLSKKYYGPSVLINEKASYNWARIRHFIVHTYYVYQYSTSIAASIAISEKVLKGDTETLNKYMDLLKAGSSDYPIELLKKVGVDMSKPDSIMPAINKFESLLNEAEKLISELYPEKQ